ncbi:TetR/AcrR family transcriptional regulator [Kribbella jiaozuonensis]|uniref:TetR/AcrR family transcriptional regulator n=1 Tax=Kribbella jiaozuonensis TaxID=2575441 RepID=A0A4V5UWS3_9ACTN|nr:TetR/AcrR family transcriptional regulator [Kribbella jiaozuonensis]TKK77893.1 TetR/AcrR family transcriptional regulator [Kribbella jiaozuonensis]
MGNREALVEGAKACLLEKGYSRTTARDIATAAGVSLAAIGYHFGSKETLLNEALRGLLTEEWATEVAGAGDERAAVSTGPREQFVATWGQVIDSLSNPRLKALWATQFEVLSLGATMPELVAELTKMQGEAREGLAQMFGGVDPDADPEQVQAIGSLLQALLLGVVAQSMFDPESAPTGEELAQSLRTLADRISPSA